MADPLEHLNPVQREAVASPPGPLLILAGAGSGKTRVLTHRIAWFLGQGVPPSAIAGVTFTNKAAGEMRRRLDVLAGPAAFDLTLHTFHALGARLLRRHGGVLGLPPGFVILDEDDSLALVKQALKKLGGSAESHGGAQGLRHAIERAKADGLTPAAASERAEGEPERFAAEVFALYEREKARSHAVDFDDLILLPTRLLTEFGEVGDAVRGRFTHLLVDEYQDTSPAQYRLLLALAGPGRNLTCVGDPDQSIYRWRGADIRNILEFEKDFPEARVVAMEQNYRSTGRILDAASALISRNRRRRPKRLWTSGAAGRPLAFYQALDETDEARLVADAVARWRHLGAGPGEFAVLYRTHAQSRVMEEALTQRGLPYAVIGGVKFYARREVKDLLAYLRLAANPADEVSLLRALSAPPRGVGETSLAKARAAAAGRPLLEALADPAVQAALPGRGRGAARDFLSLLNRMTGRLAETGYTAALTAALEESGYLTWLETRAGGETVDRRENLRELLNAVRGAEERGTSLSDFLEQAALMADLDRWEPGEPRVTLMSLHNAKGLEFTHVFITGLEDGLLPHASSFDDEEELEEERRLMYVGLTRARESVILTAARGRRQYDKFQWGQNSRFLDEIPPSLVVAVEAPESLPLGESAPAPGETGPRAEGTAEVDDFGEEPVLQPGQQVRHSHYGVGRVVRLSGAGREMRVVVAFPRSGRKTFLAGMARLTPVRQVG